MFFKLFAKITKYGWFDMLPKESGETGYSFREILQDISKFIQVNIFAIVHSRVSCSKLIIFFSPKKNSTELCVIGIRLLNELVVEINQMDEVFLFMLK